MPKYRGYTIEKGGYLDTWQDRADRWYVDREDCKMIDRSGPGYATIEDAKKEIREMQELEARLQIEGGKWR